MKHRIVRQWIPELRPRRESSCISASTGRAAGIMIQTIIQKVQLPTRLASLSVVVAGGILGSRAKKNLVDSVVERKAISVAYISAGKKAL